MDLMQMLYHSLYQCTCMWLCDWRNKSNKIFVSSYFNSVLMIQKISESILLFLLQCCKRVSLRWHPYLKILIVLHDVVNPVSEAGDPCVDVRIAGVTLATAPRRKPGQQETTVSQTNKGSTGITLWKKVSFSTKITKRPGEIEIL